MFEVLSSIHHLQIRIGTVLKSGFPPLRCVQTNFFYFYYLHPDEWFLEIQELCYKGK